jgi:Chromo (CHRromatin Organisation MOdifier) domain
LHTFLISFCCFVHVPNAKRTKLLSKVRISHLFGYGKSTKGYRVLMSGTNKVEESREIWSDEPRVHPNTGKLEQLQEEESPDVNENQFDNKFDADKYAENDKNDVEYAVDSIVGERRRKGGKEFLVRWQNNNLADSWEPTEALKNVEALDKWEEKHTKLARATELVSASSTSLKQVVISPQQALWQAAIAEELASLKAHGT